MSGIEVCIFNSWNSKISDENDSSMLWIAMIFADKVYYASHMALFLYFDEFIKDMTIIEKFNFLNKLPRDAYQENQWKQIADTVAFYKREKNKRKKGKKILMFRKVEMNLKKIINYELQSFNEFHVNKFKLEALISFTGFERTDVIMPAWHVEELTDDEKELTFITHITSFDHLLPIFDDNILEFINTGIIDNPNMEKVESDNGSFFIYSPLFKVPPLQSLDKNQLQILRTEFKKKIDPIMEQIEDTNKLFREVKYDKESQDRIQKIIDIENKKEWQNYLDENVYLEMLRSRNVEGVKYVINIGVSSLNNIIDLYKKLDLISEKVGIFAKEKLKESISLDACRIFLFLTKEKL